MEKSEKVTLLATIVIVGFALAVIFHYALGYYMHLDYPFNTFLYRPAIAFNDFSAVLPYIKDFAPYKTVYYWVNYFPLAYILLFPFSLMKNCLLSYFIMAPFFLLFFSYQNYKMLPCENLTKLQNFQTFFIINFLSYPFLFILDRGNFDMFLFILFACFVFLLKKEKFFKSAIMLAIINAIKPFFIMFLFIFLFKKKYKEFFISLFLTIALIIGGFMIFKGNLLDQISTYLMNLILFQKHFAYGPDSGMSNTSSLFMALKFILCKNTFHISTISLAKICLIINSSITILVLFFLRTERVFWKQITLLTLYMTVVPDVIFDYKLIFLFIPLWLFVNAKEKSKNDCLYSVLFGLLLIPKRFIIFPGFGNMIHWYPFSIVVNPLIMLIFIFSIIFEQIQLKRGDKKIGT